MQIVAVVSQPGKPKGRGNKSVPVPTPVEEAATSLGLAAQIMCPTTARWVTAAVPMKSHVGGFNVYLN